MTEIPSSRSTLFDDAACGLARTTAEGFFLRANQTFCEWIGYRPEELVANLKLQDLLSVGGRIFHQTHWAPLLQLQGSVSEVKLELIERSGRPVPMVMNAVRRERDGRMIHDIAVYVARDRDSYERELVLSRRNMEAMAQEARRLHAEAKDRALFAEQMIGIVSHDLRNPLQIIQMGMTLLARGEPAPNQLRVLARLSRAADRANHLIFDLLDFTQARMGKGLQLSPRPMDLRKTVAEAVEELRFAFPDRRLLHVHEGQPECHGDADRLAQVVGNLVANAMAYGAKERAVTVSSKVEGVTFAIAVHNHGLPIPEETRRALFRPMVRGSGETDAGRSVGLGLFIVSEIVKAHGGEVSVESTTEAGTTFAALLPNNRDVDAVRDGRPLPFMSLPPGEST
ncbi:MAG TPA: PAS domain-containing sensor histidine kinase [Lautropia sp.]|nr:PAS domain-containing sensor histidine kinase [Lautropia sp.]